MLIARPARPNLVTPDTQHVARGLVVGTTIPAITVTNTGRTGTWGATGLPTGLSINSTTGEITGEVDAAAAVQVWYATVTLTNSEGESSVTLPIDVRGGYTTISSGDTFPFVANTASQLYILTENINVPGAGILVLNNSIVIDLNGHEITFDDATPRAVTNGSFESETGTTITGWDLSGAANASVAAGTYVSPVSVFEGDNSLKFTVPCADQSVVASSTVALEANTWYAITAKVYNNINDSITMYVEIDGTAYNANADDRTNRGFDYVYYKFQTGGTTENVTIRAGISGAAAVASGNCYIDDIKIVRFGPHGVLVGAKSGAFRAEADYPYVTSGFFSPQNVVIKNGTLTQGQDGGHAAFGIFNESGANNPIFRDLTITVYGDDSKGIYSRAGVGVITERCIITDNCVAISSRSAWKTACIHNDDAVGGRIANCTLVGGCQNAIVAKGTTRATPLKIYGNTISQKSRYTNGNGIQLYGDIGSWIYDNSIDTYNTVGGSGHGIFVGGFANGTRIFRNTTRTKALPQNQEYNGYEYDGSYGMEIEQCTDVEIFENDFAAYADAVGCRARGMRIHPNNSPGEDYRNIRIWGNTISAYVVGSGDNTVWDGCAAIRLDGCAKNDNVDFHDNILTTDSKFIISKATDRFQMRNCTWNIGPNPPVTHEAITSYYFDSGDQPDVMFIDSAFGTGAEAVLDGSSFYNHAGTISTLSVFAKAWTITVYVDDTGGDPVAGAAISIEDTDTNEVFTGVTDANGLCIVVLEEYSVLGATKTSFNDYTVTAVSSDTQAQAVTADATKTINITLTQ